MKIFGNGFIAKNLKKKKIRFLDNYVIYAAGISNSKTLNIKELKKEITTFNNFIKKYNRSKIIIYISSMSIFDKYLKQNEYIKNKLKIESIIKKKVKKFIIIRLTQIVGKNRNPNTITNFIYNNIKNNKNLNLWKGHKRNLVDIEDVLKILKTIVKKKFLKNKILNIYNTKSISVKRIVLIMCKILKKNIKLNEIKLRQKTKQFNYKINSKNYEFGYLFEKQNYNENILMKYYK